MIALSTNKGIAIWHVGSEPDTSGRLSVERVALLSGHKGEVWAPPLDVTQKCASMHLNHTSLSLSQILVHMCGSNAFGLHSICLSGFILLTMVFWLICCKLL